MRRAVGLRAFANSQPMEEFRLEANKAFLSMLDAYRCGCGHPQPVMYMPCACSALSSCSQRGLIWLERVSW